MGLNSSKFYLILLTENSKVRFGLLQKGHNLLIQSQELLTQKTLDATFPQVDEDNLISRGIKYMEMNNLSWLTCMEKFQVLVSYS